MGNMDDDEMTAAEFDAALASATLARVVPGPRPVLAGAPAPHLRITRTTFKATVGTQMTGTPPRRTVELPTLMPRLKMVNF